MIQTETTESRGQDVIIPGHVETEAVEDEAENGYLEMEEIVDSDWRRAGILSRLGLGSRKALRGERRLSFTVAIRAPMPTSDEVASLI